MPGICLIPPRKIFVTGKMQRQKANKKELRITYYLRSEIKEKFNLNTLLTHPFMLYLALFIYI